jgi:hypothetical protein
VPRPVSLLVVSLLLAATAACDGGDDPGLGVLRTPLGRPTDSENLVVGLVGTMTGPDAWRGEDAFEGADLAIHELNVTIASDSPPFRLTRLDDGGDPATALSSLQRLASLENLVGVIYAGPPEVLAEAEDALAARGVPALLLYGDLYSERKLTPHVFQVSPPLLWQARRIGAYLGRDRRYRRFGALVRRSSLGRTAARSLRGAAPGSLRGPKVVRYDPADLGPALEALKRAHTEAVVVQGSPADFSAVVAALEGMGAAYTTTNAARIASAPPRTRRARRRSNWWAPQVVFFDLGFSARATTAPSPGTVVAETYARGAYYLPVPTFQRFRVAFREWWDGERPLGWQNRAYEAARMIGWAVDRTAAGRDIARTLEGLSRERFGSLDVSFGPDDHTAVEAATVGLWVVPRPEEVTREAGRLPPDLPWVPLARGFSIDGETLDIPPEDWSHLVRNPPPEGAPAPRFSRLRFGVRTGRKDPVH